MGASSLEGFQVKYSSLYVLVSSVFILTSCGTSFLKYDKEEQLKKIDEFDQKVQIAQPVASSSSAQPPQPAKQSPPVVVKKEKVKSHGRIKSKIKKAPVTVPVAAVVPSPKEVVSVRRQPEIEDDAGFDGRRPLQDPFRVGEEVVHDVHYFKVSAGSLRMKIDPFVTVNGRKAYALKMAINTSSLFSSFYTVDDSVDIFMDYESLVPSVFQLHVKESGQLREAKMLFNETDNTATFWERKVTKSDGVEEKRQHWDILPYTQNVYSSIYYMRLFKWEVGKEYAFRVGNDNENLVFSGKALRKEVLETKLGPMKAIVIQPNITLKGKFKSIGENLIWLSDDDRRYVLRIEAKIKIGTLISEVVEIKPGSN